MAFGLQIKVPYIPWLDPFFRMAILELTPESEYFIYIDPNDILLLDLERNLSQLEKNMPEFTLELT